MSQSMRRTGVWVGHCRASVASWNCLGVCRLVRVSRVFVAGATRGWDRSAKACGGLVYGLEMAGIALG